MCHEAYFAHSKLSIIVTFITIRIQTEEGHLYFSTDQVVMFKAVDLKL